MTAEILSQADIFSPVTWERIFWFARLVFILLDIALVCLIVYAVKRSLDFYPPFVSYGRIPFLKGKKIEASKISFAKEWEELEARAAETGDNDWAILVIDADKLVDEALRRLGFSGNSMLERVQDLARKNPKLKTLERFWKAHKARNHIAHTSGYQVTKHEAKGYLAAYESLLIELDCL